MGSKLKSMLSAHRTNSKRTEKIISESFHAYGLLLMNNQLELSANKIFWRGCVLVEVFKPGMGNEAMQKHWVAEVLSAIVLSIWFLWWRNPQTAPSHILFSVQQEGPVVLLGLQLLSLPSMMSKLAKSHGIFIHKFVILRACRGAGTDKKEPPALHDAAIQTKEGI